MCSAEGAKLAGHWKTTTGARRIPAISRVASQAAKTKSSGALRRQRSTVSGFGG